MTGSSSPRSPPEEGRGSTDGRGSLVTDPGDAAITLAEPGLAKRLFWSSLMPGDVVRTRPAFRG